MKKSMRLILDANEYIFGIGKAIEKPYSMALFPSIRTLMEEVSEFRLFIPEIIRDEVQRNLAPQRISEFYRFMFSDERIIYSSTYDVPKVLINKYHELGLKSEDALIAAFAEWQGVHFIVSDNRHFYEELKVEQFITCNAEEFLRLLTSGNIWQIIEQLEAKR